MSASQPRLLLFVGSYAEANDPGVYVYEMDSANGEIRLLDQAAGMKNPTFLGVDAEHRKVYAISETSMEGERIGEVIAFDVDTESKLRELNREVTIRPSSSHIQLDRSSRFAVVSGYHGGNVGLVQLQADGSVGRLVDERQHEGQGADPVRQDRPHPHSVTFSPDNRFALVADLGLDRIVVYSFEPEVGRLVYHSEVSTPPGAGPRHLVFHPNGEWLYSINEVNSSISHFNYDAATGELTLQDTVPTLPTEYTGENTTAEVAISADGHHLYGSNRGHDSLVHFTIDPVGGRLTLVEHVSSEGGHPRHFALTPDGLFLIAANRDNSALAVFSVEPESGRMTFTGRTVSVSKPVCVKPVWF
ncbi:lactonase family protein [Paenibacillus sp. MBLB2552]|uniref:Lactonase family protein n=1 Tax=Paenibacillus mellifer TaxID=2937794 RepID=A0A9X2BPV8_9BACL|nr:lactonase family protein [Paenibacillus mellifer]MCK8487638.1 lactonase family protein [Paenibacillus mellifer]